MEVLVEGRRLWMSDLQQIENGREFNIGLGERYGLSFGVSRRF